MVYMEYPLSFREPGILVLARQKVSRWPHPRKLLGNQSLMDSPNRQHFTHLSQLIAEEIKCLLYISTGRGLLEACTGFSLDFEYVLFLWWFCFVSFHCKEISNFHYCLSHFTFTWWPCLLFHWENKNGPKSTSSHQLHQLPFVLIYSAFPLLHDILSFLLSRD